MGKSWENYRKTIGKWENHGKTIYIYIDISTINQFVSHWSDVAN